jgi:uncharacterized SAM-binding protein YcdF (DUF218 family)
VFFYLSKILWFFAQPSIIIVALFVAGVACLLGRRARLGLRLLIAAGAFYAIAGLTPLANALLLPLERAFSREAVPANAPPHGIVVLGGAVGLIERPGRESVTLNDAAERMTEALYLARLYPAARVVFSGGESAIMPTGHTESEAARRFFSEMGVAPDRLAFEERSRNTHENAVFTKEALQPRPGERWLLITSAFHMPRAMGCFRQAGFEVIPWPVDYRTRGRSDLFRFFSQPSEGLRLTDLAFKEWLGLIAYRISGRTGSLFP